MSSPYQGIPVEQWTEVTKQLVDHHPLHPNEIVSVVRESWEAILTTKIGGELQVGVDIFPSPQILGSYLHDIIPVKLSKKHPNIWRKEKDKHEKDLVCLLNEDYSVEIKTSSNARNIFGNRSYGQENSENNSGKSKSGYYITVNFEKFEDGKMDPQITIIRFGWLDHSDWKAQASATGQAASLSIDARDKKLITLYTAPKRLKMDSF